jgi:predicted HicB family RNase H-like nuclease
MTLRREPQLYARIAAQERRDGQSLNATAVEMLECGLDANDNVDGSETDPAAQ